MKTRGMKFNKDMIVSSEFENRDDILLDMRNMKKRL